jgi:hypothetical protein
LPGTEGAASPFWSPDGRYLGFAEGPRIKKIDIEGGLPQVIAESSAGNAGVGAWSKDGVIVFGSRTPNVGIRRVPATGGTPVEVTNVDMSAGENIHSFPFFLSDARHFLYYVASSRPEVQGIYIGSVDGPLKERPSRLVEASLGPVMTAADGPDTKLFFVRDGTLMAQSFNADTALLSGTPIPVAERIGNVGSFAFFSVVSNVLPTALVRQRRPICRSFPGWAARAIYSATSENRDDFRPPPFRCRLRRTAARRRSWLRAPRLPVLTSGRSSSRAGSRRA